MSPSIIRLSLIIMAFVTAASALNCPPGSGINSKSNECSTCLEGTASIGGNDIYCRPCPINRISAITTSKCIKDSNCPIALESMSGSNSCVACPFGLELSSLGVCGDNRKAEKSRLN